MSDTQDQPRNRDEVLARMDAGWADLWSLIDRTSEERLTGPSDAAGWTAKDHLAHLTAWERSMIALFEGRPRHEGLGVPEEVYLAGDEDAINDAIFQRIRTLPLPEVRRQAEEVHATLRGIIAGLSDEDMQQPYSHFLPDEPGRDDGAPIIGRAWGNTSHHYAEHRPWIAAIIGGA